jgi:hypothetical protein
LRHTQLSVHIEALPIDAWLVRSPVKTDADRLRILILLSRRNFSGT